MRIFSIKGLFFVAAMAASSAAFADNITAVPTGWKLQTYSGVQTVLWYTGSPCTSGQLILPSTESSDRNKMLWATVLEAKAQGLKLSIDYTVSGNTCSITSFSVSPQ